MENDSTAGRIFSERLAEKIPPAIPETSAPTLGHLSIDTESAVRNGVDHSITPARIDGQTAEELAHSQRFALRTLPGKLPLHTRS
jgi:hypothetical protein